MTDDDRQLAERLRRYESRVPFREDARVSVTSRRIRWAPLVAASAVLILAVAITASFVTNRGEVGETSPTASADASPAPSETDLSVSPTPSSAAASPTPVAQDPLEIIWQEGDAETTRYVVGLAEGPVGAVAAVNVFGSPLVPPVGPDWYSDGMILLESSDGIWRTVATGSLFDGVELTSLVTAPDGTLLLSGAWLSSDGERCSHAPPCRGAIGPTSAAWSSTDGERWEPVDAAAVGGNLAAGPMGLVGVFRADEDSLVISHSSSGVASQSTVEWTISEGEFVAGGSLDAGAGPEGFVIVADRRIDDVRQPLILASGDGREWIAAPEQPALPPGTIIGQVAPIGPDWVAAGWLPVGEEPRSRITVWHSRNGLDWEIASEIASDTGSDVWPSTYASDLVSLGDVVLLSEALAAEGTDTRPWETWQSRNGQSWELLGLPTESEVRAALPRGDGALLGGRIGVEAGRATIWSWQIED